MATFLLLHGAGSDSWYWHAVAPLLSAAGHDVVAPDLPVDDDTAGFAQYTDQAVAALPAQVHRPLVVVGQSMGAFTAVMACERVPVDLLVLLAPMIPAPGETGGRWWANTDQEEAQRAYAVADGRDPDAEFDPDEVFLHDVPGAVVAAGAGHVHEQADAPFATAWEGPAWPQVPTKVVAGRFDRLFPLEFVRRVSRERLGVEPEVLDTGHLPALAQPGAVADLLAGYVAGLR
jgi:pimeloyl-ACP methyl ester carboxylesterase